MRSISLSSNCRSLHLHCTLSGATAVELLRFFPFPSIVGYQTYTLNTDAGEYIHNIGVAFDNVGTVDKSFTISNMVFGTQLQDGDNILIFNPDAYNYDFYSYTDTDGQGKMGFYMTNGDLTGDNDGYVYAINVAKGDNILFWPANGNAATVSGEVTDTTKSAVVTFTPNEVDYIFPIANPWPIDTKLKDMTMLQDGDNLLIFNPDAYNYDFYSYTDTDGQGTMGFFVTYGDLTGENDGYVVDTETVILKAGEGGLYWPTSARTWTVTLK